MLHFLAVIGMVRLQVMKIRIAIAVDSKFAGLESKGRISFVVKVLKRQDLRQISSGVNKVGNTLRLAQFISDL